MRSSDTILIFILLIVVSGSKVSLGQSKKDATKAKVSGAWTFSEVDSPSRDYAKKTLDELRTAEIHLELTGQDISGSYQTKEKAFEIERTNFMPMGETVLRVPGRAMTFYLHFEGELLKGNVMDVQNGKAFVRFTMKKKAS